MKLIVGLGNPGKKYQHTRHNAGFLAIDKAIEALGFEIADFRLNKKFNASVLDGSVGVIFAKPQTFMNNSGAAVQSLLKTYQLQATSLLVLHDDSDLPFGTLRPAFNASSAGHKGVQNIIDCLGTKKFHRLRIGVESRVSRKEMPTEAFVLQNFTAIELARLDTEILPQVANEIRKFIQIGA